MAAKSVPSDRCHSLHPAPQAEQSPLRPSAHGGWIGQAVWIFAVRAACSTESPIAMPLTGLLPATQAVMADGAEPIGQDREGLPARPTDSAAHPDAFVLVIVAWRSRRPWPMIVSLPQNGTSPRQEVQRDLPRVDVVFRLWQCDKENHGWREGPPLTVPAKVSICWPGLHPPVKSVSNEKRILLSAARREPSLRTLAGLNDKPVVSWHYILARLKLAQNAGEETWKCRVTS